MDSLFPIRWSSMDSLSARSTTIPFIFNNESYTITQEVPLPNNSAAKTYTINKLPANHPPMFLPNNYGEINFNEISEAIKFMMGAAAEEEMKRNSQRNRHQIVFPVFSTMQSFRSEPMTQSLLHYDRSTSTSDLTGHQRKKRTLHFDVGTSNRGTQAEATVGWKKSGYQIDLTEPMFPESSC